MSKDNPNKKEEERGFLNTLLTVLNNGWQGTKNSKPVEWLSTSASYAGRGWEYVSNNPVYKIATGSAVGRIASLALIGVALAASITPIPFFAPVALPLAISIAAVGVAAIAVSVAMDVWQVRSLRRLEKENNLLVKNRTARNVEEHIFQQNPNLETTLKDQLYAPQRDGKKSTNERYNPTIRQSGIKSAGKAAANNALPIASAALGIVASGPSGIFSLGGAIGSFVFDVMGKATVESTKDEFKTRIDKERDKPDTLGYDSIGELRDHVNEQRIQSLALIKLISDPNFPHMTDAEIVDKFQENKQEIGSRRKFMPRGSGVVAQFTGGATHLGKDFIAANNPFSRYVDVEKMQFANSEAPESFIARHNYKSRMESKITENMEKSKKDIDGEHIREALHHNAELPKQKSAIDIHNKANNDIISR